MRKVSCTLLLALSISSATTVTTANGEHSAAWQALRYGQALILMRHALAPGTGDPSNFELTDCATQRNLSDAGRAQAVAIGQTLRANGINEATVLSSQWCRCLETAALIGVGEPEPAPMVNSFFQDWSTQREQTQALHNSLRDWLANDKNARVIVTHQVNINAFTGQLASSGDMLIVTLEDDEPVVLAQISTD